MAAPVPRIPAAQAPALTRQRPGPLQIRPTPYPDPYGGAYAPLTDLSWFGIPASVRNVTPGAAPPPMTPMPVVQTPPPERANGVKFTQQKLEISDAQSILPERLSRQFLLIQNAAGGTIYVGFSEIPNAQSGIEILVGGALLLNDPAPTNQIYVVCPTATATVRVLEG